MVSCGGRGARKTLRLRNAALPLPEQPADLGIAHTSIFRSVCVDSSAAGGEAGSGIRDPWDARMSEWRADSQSRVAAALECIRPLLEKLPDGSVVVEIGSRCGDLTVDLCRRFPRLNIQPTEGVGQTSTSLHLLLQERISDYNRQCLLDGAKRILPVRMLDPASSEHWAFELGRRVGMVLLLNIAQFLGPDIIRRVVEGSRRTLRVGGLLVLCGPLFDGGGPPGDSRVLYDDGLRRFAGEASDARAGFPPLAWRMPSVSLLRKFAESEGLDFVEQQNVIGSEGWAVVIFRQSSPAPRPLVLAACTPSLAAANGGRWRSSLLRRGS